MFFNKFNRDKINFFLKSSCVLRVISVIEDKNFFSSAFHNLIKFDIIFNKRRNERMKCKRDIIDMLFEKKEQENDFKMNNWDIKEYRKKLKVASDKLNKFIDNNINEKNREDLKKLIDNKIDEIYNISFYESKLYYRSGIEDGLFLKSLNNN